MRIVFMGTPDFAVSSLKKLHESNNEIVGVVTSVDKPAGRGKKIVQSAVKKYALENNLTLFQPSNLKNNSFTEELKNLSPDVFIVVAFRMLPKVVWEIPTRGTFNLHASLLPHYRGAAPINWAIINQEKTTGITTFFIDEKIDTGQIILQKEVTISKKETASSLHDKLADNGSQLILDTLKYIEQGGKSIPQQSSGKEKDAPKLTKENTRIDWTKNLNEIDAFIRGLNPYPSAWTVLNSNNEEFSIKIFDVSIVFETHTLPNFEIIATKKELKITHPQGFIIINELQFPNKKRMSSNNLLNGFQFEKNFSVS